MKNLFVLLGLFIGVGAISLSCRNNYKEKYIHLLEEHINTLNIEEIEDAEAPDLEPMIICLLYTSPSPRDRTRSRMPSSA